MLKLFSKSASDQEEGSDMIEAPTREQRLELNLRDLGLEVLQLRQEINSMMIRQQAFKIALGQLRDHLRNYAIHAPLRSANALIPCSQHEANVMTELGFGAIPSRVVPLMAGHGVYAWRGSTA